MRFNSEADAQLHRMIRGKVDGAAPHGVPERQIPGFENLLRRATNFPFSNMSSQRPQDEIDLVDSRKYVPSSSTSRAWRTNGYTSVKARGTDRDEIAIQSMVLQSLTPKLRT